jgi:prefoldin subunit 5
MLNLLERYFNAENKLRSVVIIILVLTVLYMLYKIYTKNKFYEGFREQVRNSRTNGTNVPVVAKNVTIESLVGTINELSDKIKEIQNKLDEIKNKSSLSNGDREENLRLIKDLDVKFKELRSHQEEIKNKQMVPNISQEEVTKFVNEKINSLEGKINDLKAKQEELKSVSNNVTSGVSQDDVSKLIDGKINGFDARFNELKTRQSLSQDDVSKLIDGKINVIGDKINDLKVQQDALKNNPIQTDTITKLINDKINVFDTKINGLMSMFDDLKKNQPGLQNLKKLHILSDNSDPGSEQLVIGDVKSTNLRLGHDAEYSWIQSHGNKPLRINQLGNNVEIGAPLYTGEIYTNGLKFSKNWTGYPDNATDKSEISNDITNYKQLMIVGNKSAGSNRKVGVWDELSVHGNQIIDGDLSVGGNLGSNKYTYVNRYSEGGVQPTLQRIQNKAALLEVNPLGGNQAPGCPDPTNWSAVCPANSVMVGLTNSCDKFYPICKSLK